MMDQPAIETTVARVLSRGALVSTIVIAAGVLMEGLDLSPITSNDGRYLIVAGMSIFIALPILRVTMVFQFMRKTGDRIVASFAFAVLGIIALSIIIGLTY
ncbi:MAG TPA: hypothetical protein VNZ58_11210 [Thermomicrobiales bacterium]|nr:hypothetical protein [Thermomicrobiales bacterium]